MRYFILLQQRSKGPRSEPYDGALRRRMREQLMDFAWRATALWVVLLFACFWSAAQGDLAADANGLTMFKQAVDKGNRLSWNGSDICSWPGIECLNNLTGQATSRVVKLRVGRNKLSGSIPSGSLSQLTELRVLNLGFNGLSGSLPTDLTNCGFLRNVYLQNNNFSGPLPSDFSHWPNLNRLDVSFNNFSGDVSPSLADAEQLYALYLQNNSLTGSLPPLNATLQNFNASNNHLTGSIPLAYQKFDQSSFLGNNLCGGPLQACLVTPPPGAAPSALPSSTPDSHHKKGLSAAAIAGIVIAGLAVVVPGCLLCVLYVRRSRSRDSDKKGNLYARSSGDGNNNDGYSAVPRNEMGAIGAAVATSVEPERKRLVFFEGTKHDFDLEDLLRASAEVLGKGSVGTSYKAVLETGTIVAVKRLKDVSMEKRDFETRMQSLGNLKHANLVPLIAYYYSREEKLLVSSYMTNGSLSALLHGNKEASSTPLDWDTRVKIALGAALGIQHLHENNVEHGNIKSSNILLTSNYTGCVSDYGLVQLVNPSSAANRMVGYRAPEVNDIRKPTSKTDVYSFGVVLLELLTGRAPSQSSGEGRDLPRWVQSVDRSEDDWRSEVFDPQLTKFRVNEDEMERVLNVALDCVKPSPDQRPSMKEVAGML